MSTKARDVTSKPVTFPDQLDVAILGDFLPNRIQLDPEDPLPLNVIASDSNPQRLAADLAGRSVDLLVVEAAVVDETTPDMLRRLMNLTGVPRVVLVYTFGTTKDVDRLRYTNTIVLRTPVGPRELRAACMRVLARPLQRDGAPRDEEPAGTALRPVEDKAEPRRFSPEQLSRLAAADKAIDCECPRHLVQLVHDLTAFEMYSAACTNRDEADAALHRYLHWTASRARALIEAALEEVATAEGIEY